MHVLIIPSWYPIGSDKLMGIYHKDFCEALNQNGIKSNILYIEKERIKNPLKFLINSKKEEIEESNYNTYIYRMLNLEKISFKLQTYLYVKKMRKSFLDYVKKKGKPDIIHAQVIFPAGYAASVIGKEFNIPVLITEHASYFKKILTEDKYTKYISFALKNSKYSTVSNYMKVEVENLGIPASVIPNIVDTAVFTSVTNRKKHKEFKLISVCALRKGKDIDILLDAIKILKNEKFIVKLDIVGDGFLEKEYKDYASKLKLDNQINFLGRLSKSEINELFKKEDALIISSKYETFGIPGIEALASGLPIITTDCHGPVEYVNKKTGVICKTGDAVDMADKIKELYENYEKIKPKDLIKMAQKYSYKTVIKDVKNIYKSILEEKNEQ